MTVGEKLAAGTQVRGVARAEPDCLIQVGQRLVLFFTCGVNHAADAVRERGLWAESYCLFGALEGVVLLQSLEKRQGVPGAGGRVVWPGRYGTGECLNRVALSSRFCLEVLPRLAERVIRLQEPDPLLE